MTDYLSEVKDCSRDRDQSDATLHEWERPLPHGVLRIICQKWNAIIEVLMSDDLFLNHLEQANVFTKLQIKRLKVSRMF